MTRHGEAATDLVLAKRLQGSIYTVSVSRKALIHEDTIGLLRPRRSNTRGGLVLALSQCSEIAAVNPIV